MPRPTRWTDDELRAATAQSCSLVEVCHALALRPGGRTYESLTRHMARLGIDASHLGPRRKPGGRPARRSNIDAEHLRDAVEGSITMAQVLRRLGHAPTAGMYRYVKLLIRQQGLSTGHFVGQAWARGRVNPRQVSSRPLSEILVAGSVYSSGRLRQRLIAAGLKQQCCESCGSREWLGRPMPLTLDHVNGDPSDNRLENLRILCPNCHALTDTWCGRNRGRRTPTGSRDQT